MDGDIEFFDIFASVLQGDTLAQYLFITSEVLQTLVDLMRVNGFRLAKARIRIYLAWLIMDADYADDIALRVNIPAQAESLLHSLKRATGGIGPHFNEYMCFNQFMCFNQRGDISTLNGRSQKLVDKFTYFRSSVSSTENDINTQLAMAWTAISKLSVLWKSDLSYKIKQFFQAVYDEVRISTFCKNYCDPQGTWVSRKNLTWIKEDQHSFFAWRLRGQ